MRYVLKYCSTDEEKQEKLIQKACSSLQRIISNNEEVNDWMHIIGL